MAKRFVGGPQVQSICVDIKIIIIIIIIIITLLKCQSSSRPQIVYQGHCYNNKINKILTCVEWPNGEIPASTCV